jgi:hypothetical protein
VAWTDDRNYPTSNYDAYAQQLLPTGAITPGWPSAGLALSSAAGGQIPSTVVSDGSGGVFVVWEDSRSFSAPGWTDIYAQHVTSAGVPAPGWPSGGLPVVAGPGNDLPAHTGDSHFRVAVPDGEGGFIFVFTNHGVGGSMTNGDVYLQRITALGTPAPGWPAHGLPVCIAAGNQEVPSLISDGAGGAILAWTDPRSGVPEVYGTRVHADGTLAAGWVPNGTLLVAAPMAQFHPRLVPDGAGGAFLAYFDLRNAPVGSPDPYEYTDIYAMRVTGAGVPAPGWPVGGVPVTTAGGEQVALVACESGVGELYLAWSGPGAGGRGLVAKVTAAGAIAPFFGSQGRAFASYTGTQHMEGIVPDGMGGAYLI